MAPGVANTTGVHTIYALQCGYEQLIHQLGSATASDVEHIRQQLMLSYDSRDLLAARDSLEQISSIRLLDVGSVRVALYCPIGLSSWRRLRSSRKRTIVVFATTIRGIMVSDLVA